MNRDYELGFILNPEASEEEIRAILDRIEQIVANYGGQIVKVNQWGRRRLAYPISRQRDGFYIFLDMILTPETVTELERTLKVSEIVLRHMVRKRDAKAVQKEREEREEREARAAAAAAAAPAAEQSPEQPEETTEQAPVPEFNAVPAFPETETGTEESAIPEAVPATPTEETIEA